MNDVAVTVEDRDGAALITFANPPVNALSVRAGLVPALLEALRQQTARTDIGAIVLRGAGKFFAAGADILDFGEDPKAVRPVRDLMDTLDRAPVPVVMAIHGLALGGGLELALAGHYRVCAPGTRFGFPEVLLGLLPGAGGTQNLPRLTGALRALELISSGKEITAEAALAAGIVDELAAGDVSEAALAAANRLKGSSPARVRDREADMTGFAEAAEKMRAELRRKPPLGRARSDIIGCIAAAAGPYEDGLALEHRRFDELMLSEPSRGLRHAFFAPRTAMRIPGLAPTIKAAPIRSAAVVGAGLMGTGIATVLLAAGLPVTLIEPRDDARTRAQATVRANFERDVAKGRLREADAAERAGRLTCSADIAASASADLVIEAVFEDMAVKREVFTALDRIAKPDAILASNTSTLDLDAIAGFTARPRRVLGMHFFSPAYVMKLLEIVRGVQTDTGVLETIRQFARQLGKVAVIAGNCDGFIGNRMFEEYLRQTYFLLEEGALPDQIDRALEAWGMAMGPLRTMDLAGQDIGWSIRKRRALEHPDRPYSKIPDMVCELGRYGQKTGKGFYLYPDGRKAIVDPEIDALVVRHSHTLGLTRRAIEDAEIVERCVLALVNEGARLLAEGFAYRPADIDVVWLNGYGFPAERGGPMFYADRLGLNAVVARLRHYAAGRQGWAWEPSTLLVDLAARDATLASLNDR